MPFRSLTLKRSLFWIASFTTALPTFAFQVAEPTKSALERRGLYHENIRGRFVSSVGEPVSGVHVQLSAGRTRALPLADAVTDAQGRFAFHDISSAYMPDLRWYPPEQWMRGASALMGESGGDIDAGTIRLQLDTVIRVAVELVGQPPPMQVSPNSNLPSVSNLEPNVVLQGKGQLGPRIVGQQIGAIQVLRQIPFDDGTWQISLFANGRTESYQAPFHVQRGRRDQLILLRLLRSTVKVQNQYAGEGKLEVSETLLPPIPIEREFEASGRVLAPDGNPVEGAFVNVNDFFLRRSTPQWTATDNQGKFQFRYRAAECNEPSVSYGDGDFWRTPDQFSNRVTCEERWRDPRDLVVPSAARLSIQADGIDTASVRAYWWHDSFGWQKFSSMQPWISLSGFGEKQVKIEADGLLPAIQTLKLPFINVVGSEKPPESVTVEFHLDRAAQRELIVLESGKALSGATVDVEAIENLEKDSRRILGTYKTPADGRIRLAGGGDQLVEAFVYADGFEPRRAIWNPGAALTLDLPARNATLSFAASPSAFVARVRDTSAPSAVRTVKLNATASSVLMVAPGTYDVTVYGNRGEVLRYQRVAAAAGQTAAINETADQRPRVTVRYPADGWHTSISESVPRGGATGWAAMISVAGSLTFSDTPATLESESSHEAVFLLSHAGKMHVEMRRTGQSLTLWRDIAVRPGESVMLNLPASEATLKGSMRSYDGGTFSSIHGFAGPRMQLISEDPAGWSVTEYIPARDGSDGSFTVKGIPAGNYRVYQHLIGEREMVDGKPASYVTPIAAWGGVSVQLEAGATAQLQDFIDYPYQDLQVLVTDQAGRPLDHGTVRIRDRMSESWRQVEENPAQLEEAAHPIPYPAAARLTQGRATLPRVRAGALDLFVELDSGAAYSITATAALGQELHLTVPAAGAR